MKWSQDDKQKFVELCPESVSESLVAYIETGRPTGGFLYALLSNDLREAFGRADMTNRHCMFEIVVALHNYAPAPCWGNKEKVEAWLKACADERSKK
jgi:hypothetical protein